MSQIAVPIPPTTQRLLHAESSALLKQLVNAVSPAAVDAWMSTNVTTLAQARTVLTALALGLRYVYLKDQ